MSYYVMPNINTSEYIGPDNIVTQWATVPTAPRHTPLANLQPNYPTGQALIKFGYLRNGKIKSFIKGRVDMHVAKEVEAKIGLLERRWSQHAQLLRDQGVARLKEADRVFEKWRHELKAVEAQFLTNEVEEIRVENQDLMKEVNILNAEKRDLEDEKKYLEEERRELRELNRKIRHENRRLRRMVQQGMSKTPGLLFGVQEAN